VVDVISGRVKFTEGQPLVIAHTKLGTHELSQRMLANYQINTCWSISEAFQLVLGNAAQSSLKQLCSDRW